MKKSSYLTRFLIWRAHNISDRQFILFLSMVIGIAVGFGAVLIKNLVRYIHEHLNMLTRLGSDYQQLLYPLIGLLLTVAFIKYINKRPVRHGIPSVLYAISKANGYMHQHNLISSIITSALTVGFGGSVGLEGPTVATGAAIGSNTGRLLRLNQRQIMLLLGCASAGAMSAIFKAPITGVVFVLEVMMFDLTMAAIVPFLISSATAVLTSYFFLGQNVLYPFEITEKFAFKDVTYYIILGIVTGLVAVYFTKTYIIISDFFERIKGKFNRVIIGASVLGVLIFFIPSLFGEGYEAINKCLRVDTSYLFDGTIYAGLSHSFIAVVVLLILVFLFKAVATSITFGGGGVGGVFAPTLFVGANVGLVFSKLLDHFGLPLSQSNFALAGMAGMIAGVIHAPLTAIFLIAEITGGYQLFIPLMIVATISYATVRIFLSNSVYTIQLAKRGELITHHKDKAVLMMMNIKDLIEKDFNIVHPDDSLGELIQVIVHAHRNIFPVVEKDYTFRGIVKMDDIRHIMFNQELYDKIFVRDLMFMPENVVQLSESVEEVAKKFQDSGRYNIAVIENGKYLGFVSRAKTFSAYRKLLKDFSEH